MSLIDALRHRIRSALHPNAADDERAEEHAFHQSLAAQQRTHAGEAPDAARHAARREFGNATYLREEARWMGVTRALDATAQDLRFGWRALRRSPLFAVVAALSLGLGIGANAVIFGLIHSLLLARLPVDAPRELRLVSHEPEGVLRAFFTPREVDALRATPNVDFATLRAMGVPRAEVNGTIINGLGMDAVDGAFFRIVRPGVAAGRLIGEADEQNATPVVVISHEFATANFGAAGAAVGKAITISGVAFTVVGVTKAGYEGLSPGSDYTLAIPSTTLRLVQGGGAGQPDAFLVTRLRSDSARTANSLDAAFAACCANGELARANSRRGDQRIGFIDISHGITEGKKVNVREQYSTVLFALMGGVAVLLLIACTNVGNLLMARAAIRGREFAVRLSLGASRGRLVRQLLVEAILLAAIGGAAGIMLAIWGSALLSRNLPAGLGLLEPFIAIRPGLTIFGFTAGVALACAVVFGVLPALRATGGYLVAGLRESQGSQRHTRGFDRGVVAIQVGLALLLVTSAGLLVTTLKHLTSAVGGSNPETLMAVQLDSRGTRHSDTTLQAAVPELMRRFRGLPGVRTVAETYVVPLIYGGLPTYQLDRPGLEDLSEEQVAVATINVGPGYFGTLGIRLIGGRDFDERDLRGSPKVAVVSENLARHFFADRNPIGEVIGFRGETRSITIVGVVGDAKQVDLRSPAPWTVYRPHAQAAEMSDRAVFAIRTVGDPALVIPGARAAILEALPDIRIRHLHPMTNLLSITVGKERALAMLSVAFGALAVLLAAVGLYGVMAFQVSARTREIGVRMALGASRRQVVRMVVGQALALVALGVVIGVPLSLVGANALRALLYGVTPFDPIPLALSAAVLVAVGAMASLLPSRSAARVDPLIAIRSE
jgi:putative ABC transport system permease protein